MAELLPCPFCGGKMIVSPFIYKVLELPKPIKLFGRWSLIKQRYRELPINYTVDCDDFCDGWCNSKIFIVEETEEKAINAWNTRTPKERGGEK